MKGQKLEHHPASLNIDYSNQSDKLSVLFRIFFAIPILVVASSFFHQYSANFVVLGSHRSSFSFGFIISIVFFPTLLMILFRRKYPKWWFDWNLSITKFYYRITSYLLLLRDEYPSTDEEQAVHLELAYPDVENELERGLPLVKWIFIIPHICVLLFLFVCVIFCTISAWFIILFTGRYPKDMFEFVVGFLRWSFRVDAYARLLATDEYPPFSLAQ
jgi:hypothetical protein